LRLDDLKDGALEVLRNAGAYASDLVQPTLRLGVTGLARSGKTVFITALVQALTARGRLPLFRPVAEKRILRAFLEPQPDDQVPRFEIEKHLAALTGSPPAWPESTRRLSELRITIEYQPTGAWRHLAGTRRLNLDIVDYPGEWLLDLPLMGRSFDEWSGEALALSHAPERKAAAGPFHAFVAGLSGSEPADEQKALAGATHFRAYLERCRSEARTFSSLSPGRFLMPGELEGSPALTFFPLAVEAGEPAAGSLHAMLARRYNAYVRHVARPFFRDHFSRLDRQIVLVDALSALHAGPSGAHELARALQSVLASFKPGPNRFLSPLVQRRIDRILFAATKADHLHHTSHDRLEAILAHLIGPSIDRAQLAGASVRVQAIAAVRATREVTAEQKGESLACIKGVPLPGECLGERRFDGSAEATIFPGDLPAEPSLVLEAGGAAPELAFPRFRPPVLAASGAEGRPAFPHIRLDRALDFLLGDRLA
jgi:hypothetical protein